MSTNMKFLLKDFENYRPEFRTCYLRAFSMAGKVAKKVSLHFLAAKAGKRYCA